MRQWVLQKGWTAGKLSHLRHCRGLTRLLHKAVDEQVLAALVLLQARDGLLRLVRGPSCHQNLVLHLFVVQLHLRITLPRFARALDAIILLPLRLFTSDTPPLEGDLQADKYGTQQVCLKRTVPNVAVLSAFYFMLDYTIPVHATFCPEIPHKWPPARRNSFDIVP